MDTECSRIATAIQGPPGRILHQEVIMDHATVLAANGFTKAELNVGALTVRSPIDGAEVARVAETSPADMANVVAKSQEAFKVWRKVPAPRRGELVRLLGEELRAAKETLGALVTLEAGKSLRRSWRSPGDDRHLRFRRGFVASASWSDHRLRTTRARDARNLASGWSRRRHNRLQFSRGGLVLEHGAGACLWRPGDLETIRENAADRHGLHENP